MITTYIIILIAGICLGHRAKVLALIPITMFIVLGTVAASMVEGATIGSAAATAFGTAIALQLGYVFGLATQSAVLGARSAKPSFSGRTTTSRPSP
jgi:hypothetical protein